MAVWAWRTGIVTERPRSVLHGFSEELRRRLRSRARNRTACSTPMALPLIAVNFGMMSLGAGWSGSAARYAACASTTPAAAQPIPPMTSTPWVAPVGQPGDDKPAHGVRFEVLVAGLLRENPPVARVAHRVECRQPGRAVVGLVEAIGRLDFVTGAEYDVRLEPADLPADVAAKVEAVDEHAVRMFEDGQVLEPNAGWLLLRRRLSCRLPGRVRHPGLAAGEQEITDLDAARGPASDGRGRAVLHVVRVRDDAEHALEGLLGEGRQCHAGHPSRTVPGQ